MCYIEKLKLLFRVLESVQIYLVFLYGDWKNLIQIVLMSIKIKEMPGTEDVLTSFPNLLTVSKVKTSVCAGSEFNVVYPFSDDKISFKIQSCAIKRQYTNITIYSYLSNCPVNSWYNKQTKNKNKNKKTHY